MLSVGARTFGMGPVSWAFVAGLALALLACGDDNSTGAPAVVAQPTSASTTSSTAPSHRGSFAPPPRPSPLAQPLATRRVLTPDAGVDAREPAEPPKVVERTVVQKVVVLESMSPAKSQSPPRNEVAGRGGNADPADEVAETLQPGQKPKGNTDAVEEVAGQRSPNFDPPEEIAGQ